MQIFGLIILIVILFLAGGWLLLSVGSLLALIKSRGVPYVPLSKKQLRTLLKNVKLKPASKVVDLGCGDGRVLRAFEKTGIKYLRGYELNWQAYLVGKIKNYFLKSKIKIYLKNFNEINLEKFDVVFCYLLESALLKLRKKFDSELKPGTKIISFGFEIKEWKKPSQVIITDKNRPTLNKIFIYEK